MSLTPRPRTSAKWRPPQQLSDTAAVCSSSIQVVQMWTRVHLYTHPEGLTHALRVSRVSLHTKRLSPTKHNLQKSISGKSFYAKHSCLLFFLLFSFFFSFPKGGGSPQLQLDLRGLPAEVCSPLGWTGLILLGQPQCPVTRKPVQTLLRGTQCSCPSMGTGGHVLHSGPGHGHPEPASLLPLLKLAHFQRRGSASLRLVFPMSSV